MSVQDCQYYWLLHLRDHIYIPDLFDVLAGRIFFREIKQPLHIKSFIGTSQNAVMIQMWTALITILMLKALKAMAKFNWYLSNLVAFIRLNLFVKIDLQQWIDSPFEEHHGPSSESITGVQF